MAIAVPSASTVTTKWTSRASVAANDYKTAVSGAGGRWQAAVDSSEENWQAGVMAAAANDSYQMGVAGKGGYYQSQAADKGFRNYGPGVQGGASQFSTKIGKVLNVISGVNLGPKGPTNSPQNYQRSAQIGDVLHAAKLRGDFV